MTGAQDMREQAMDLLCRHNESPALIRHALCVEAVMRHFAALAGEDRELYGAVGLLHDLDYERWPQEHCRKSAELLRDAGYDETVVRAVLSHGYRMFTVEEPVSHMERVLYTVDELTGLIAAAALMRPSRSVMDLEVASVKKKWKDKAFAAGVNREVISRGCEMLGLSLDEVIARSIAGMRLAAPALSL